MYSFDLKSVYKTAYIS